MVDADAGLKKQMSYMQSSMIMFKQSIMGRIQEFLQAGTAMMAEIGKMHACVETGLLSKFSAKDVLKMLLWVDAVSEKTRFGG